MTTKKITLAYWKATHQTTFYPLILNAIIPYYVAVNLSQPELDFFLEKWFKKTKRFTHESLINFLNLYSKNGVEAFFPPFQYKDGIYWKIDAVSNSALSSLKHELMGTPKRLLGRNGVFGSAFHEKILEPHLYDFEKYNLRPSEKFAIGEMTKSLEKDMLFNKLFSLSEKEVTAIWTDEKTGLKCKGKIDMNLPARKEIIDLKTTAARSQKEFEEAMNSYDYDRQGFHYMDGASAERCRFIGVQKIAPFNVYHFAFKRDSDFVKRGKKKRDFLLRKYKDLKA